MIPRDLFNEAKLLKCLGRLSLEAEKYGDDQLRVWLDKPGEGFPVGKHDCSGEIFCDNVRIRAGGVNLVTSSPLNSRLNYPLTFMGSDGEENYVFEDDGAFTEEFLAVMNANTAPA